MSIGSRVNIDSSNGVLLSVESDSCTIKRNTDISIFIGLLLVVAKIIKNNALAGSLASSQN